MELLQGLLMIVGICFATGLGLGLALKTMMFIMDFGSKK